MESLEQAKAAVVCEDVFYDSAWQGRRIHAQVWLPAPGLAPCGIVQLVHGMEEYIGRYDDFARFLCAQGFVVCGSDHIGHGQSVGSTDELSLLPVDGARMMIADVRSLQVRMQERFGAQLPYILFGHSMGSFVARAFLARFGSSLDGAIICGTGEVPVAASRAGGWLARRMAASEGPDAKSAFINSLADGAYGKKIKDARTSLDWLNTDPAQVDAYIADPLCGVMFSVGGYASLMDLTAEVASAQCAGAVPDGLPVLFIAGEQDPVGDFGTGVKAAADAMRQHSKARVETILYPGMRHEILNEPEHLQVYLDVLAFLQVVLAEAGGADCAAIDGAAADGAGQADAAVDAAPDEDERMPMPYCSGNLVDERNKA